MKSVATILRAGVILLIVLLPWQARYFLHQPQLNGQLWEYGTIAVYAWDVLLFLAVALAWLTNHVHLPKRWPMLSWPVGGLLVLSLFSILVADERTPALFGVWLLFKAAVFFGLILAVRPSGSSIILALLVSMGLQGVVAVSQVLAGHISANTWLGMAEQIPGNLGVSVIETAQGRFLRGYGSFPHPNMLGGASAIALTMGAGWLTSLGQRLRRWQRLAALLALAACSAGLVISFSRAAWLAAGLGMLFVLGSLLVRRTALWPMTMIGLIIGASAGLTLGLLPGAFSSRLSSGNRLTGFSQEQRSGVWHDAVQLGERHWLVGVGLRNFTSAAASFHANDRPARTVEPVHAVPALIVVESGILGLLAVVWVLWESTIAIARSVRSRRQATALLWAAGWLVLLGLSFFDHYLWTFHSGLLLWSVVGAGWLLARES